MENPIARIKDDRNYGEKMAWKMLGAPLYYCEDCLKRVKISGDPPKTKRQCEHHDARIIAPRRAIVHGEGGLNFGNQVLMMYYKSVAAITGRTV